MPKVAINDNNSRMKIPALLIFAASMAASSPLSKAVTILSQNFDTGPVNYTNTPFVIQASDPTRYWSLSNAPGISLNPGVLGNATTYVAAQNMNNDGDGTLVFDGITVTAAVNFDVSVTGFTDLKLSIDIAGMPNAEPENYVRASTDVDGDGVYELMLFNFMGTGNTAYADAVLGPLTETFATFSNISLPTPTAANRILHLRIEVFNDTNSQNEASGIDNIIISGVPEPSSAMLAGLAGLSFLRRRRR